MLRATIGCVADQVPPHRISWLRHVVIIRGLRTTTALVMSVLPTFYLWLADHEPTNGSTIIPAVTSQPAAP